MKKMTYAEAIRDGIRVEMKRDPAVYPCGEDVGKFGGCFGVTAGLVDEFQQTQPVIGSHCQKLA